MLENKKDRRFSNKKENLFDEIKKLDNRYLYSINKLDERITQEIHDEKIRRKDLFKREVEGYQGCLQNEVFEIGKEIEKNLKALEKQEMQILEIVSQIYGEKYKSIIKEILPIIGFDF